MTYKTIVIDHVSKAKKIAAAIERTANEMAQNGWALVTVSTVKSKKAILVFRVQDDAEQEESVLQESTAEADEESTDEADEESTAETVEESATETESAAEAESVAEDAKESTTDAAGDAE